MSTRSTRCSLRARSPGPEWYGGPARSARAVSAGSRQHIANYVHNLPTGTPPPSSEPPTTVPRDGERLPNRAGTAARRRLLVVDDEPVIRQLVTWILHTTFDVTGAGSVDEAAALLRADPGRYDVVLTDLHMPERSGLELFTWIRRHQPQLSKRVGLMTGGAIGGADEDFLSRTQLHCLFKPFSQADLVTLVAELDEAP